MTARPGRLPAVVLGLLAAKLAMHLAVAIWTPYEFHRDEFLYFAMGNHLRIFHMDFPPLIALLAEVVRAVSETSLVAYRAVPALAGTLVLLMTMLLVRDLGGGRTAQVLAAIAVLFNPLFLRTASLFQPVVLDQLWWLVGFWALIRLERSGDHRWWLLLGAAGGLGLLSKFSVLFYGAAVLAALVLTPHRRAFLTPWPWAAIGLALLLGAPSIIGQVTLGFPVFDQMAGLSRGQLARITFAEFLGNQLLWGPGPFLLALAGLSTLLAGPLREYRVAGLTALAAFALFAIARGKSYYVGPIYPLLFAAGATSVERIGRRRLRSAIVGAVAALTVLYGLVVLPLGLPIVPPEPMARYARTLGIGAATRTNRGEQLALPQDYADMLGWREKAEAVAEVYRSLSAEDRRDVVLYGANYGRAGALEFYGRALDLPPVISLSGSFWLFGPGTRTGRVLILLGVEADELGPVTCGALEEVHRIENPWGVPEERDVPVLLCRDPNLTPREVWARIGPEWG